MEGMEKPIDSKVQGAIDDLVKKAPEEPAIKKIKHHLENAARAAAAGNDRLMNENIGQVHGTINILSMKGDVPGKQGFDVLDEYDNAVEAIRSSLKK